jgi:hypothetical protein
MEKIYKGHLIQITVEKDDDVRPWNPTCRVLDGASLELIKQFDWHVGYATPDQAEKIGLLLSKKWIDAGKL